MISNETLANCKRISNGTLARVSAVPPQSEQSGWGVSFFHKRQQTDRKERLPKGMVVQAHSSSEVTSLCRLGLKVVFHCSQLVMPKGVGVLKKTIRKLRAYARINKKRDVVGEKFFRHALMRRKMHYQRQKVIGNYIVDFYFPKRCLIVEIDGPYHSNNQEYDQKRQEFLQGIGFTVLRFTDDDVMSMVDRCCDQVEEYPQSRYNRDAARCILSSVNGVFYQKKARLAKKPNNPAKPIAKRYLVTCAHGRRKAWCTECRYRKAPVRRPL